MQAARILTDGDAPPLGIGLTMSRLLIQGEEDRVRPAAQRAARTSFSCQESGSAARDLIIFAGGGRG